MALPVLIYGSSNGTDNSDTRPFLSSGGNVYVFVSFQQRMYKATDPTSSFSGVDTANEPTSGIGPYSIIQDSDKLRIISGAGDIYSYHVFNMSSDSWETTDETIVDYSSEMTPPGINYVDIAVRAVSGDEVVVVLQGLPDTNMGSNYERIDLFHKDVTGSTWTGPIAIDNGAFSTFQVPRLLLGTNNNLHINWGITTDNDPYFRTLDSSNSLSTEVSITTDSSHIIAPGHLIGNSLSYDSSGTQVLIWGCQSPNGYGVILTNENASTTDIEISSPDGTDILTTAEIHDIVFDSATSTIYSLVVDTTNNKTKYATSTDDGQNFSSFTDHYTGGSNLVQDVPRSNLYTRSGSKKLAYTFVDSVDDLYYHEIDLGGGGGPTRRVFLIS